MSMVYDIDYHLTVIGMSLSSVCYLWVACVYIKKQNVPNCNLASLCIALLLSDVMTFAVVLRALSKLGCVIVAVTLHFTLLVGHTWTVLISYEIATQFIINMYRNSKSMRRYYVYCLISILLPGTFVGLLTIFDHTGVLPIGYGSDTMACWINSGLSGVLCYILPGSALTIASVSLMLYTMIYIWRSRRHSMKQVQRHGSSQDVPLLKTTFRLMILLGAIDLVGLIQIPNPSSCYSFAANAFFKILFSLLRSFRGVNIWVLYALLPMVSKPLQRSQSVSVTVMSGVHRESIDD